MKHEVLEEVWRIRDQIAAECGYDVDRLFKRIRELEARHKDRLVPPPPRNAKPEVMAVREEPAPGIVFLPRASPRVRPARRSGHRDEVGQPHPRERESMARERSRGHHAHHARIDPALATRGAGRSEAVVLRPA